MTNKLNCPYCGAELTINPHPFDGCVKARCANVDCRYAEWTFPLEIWQALIDGKAAQDALKEIKETVDTFKDSEFAEDMRDCVRDVSRIIASIPTEKDK